MNGNAKFFTLLLLASVAGAARPRTRLESQIQPARDVLDAQESGEKPAPFGDDNRIAGTDIPLWAKEKQRKALLHANLEKSKNDAAELATLAQQLREELDKPNASPLSPPCAARLEKIAKLAKKIRDELTVY